MAKLAAQNNADLKAGRDANAKLREDLNRANQEKEEAEAESRRQEQQADALRTAHEEEAANKPAELPAYDGELIGFDGLIRIVNPTGVSVLVGLRSAGRGKDFTVPANGYATIPFPEGDYELYFIRSDDKEPL